MNKTRTYDYFNFCLNLSKVLVVLVMIGPYLAFAQEREIKKDSLKINDSISGIAEFEYDASEGEDYYDGKFNFQSVSNSQLESFDYKVISYEGEFSANKKSGDWSYSNKKMKQEDQKFISGFRIGNLATGTENFVAGEFQEGKALGKWQSGKIDFIESEVNDTLFQIESTFKDNRLAGSLNSTSKSIAVQGYFNADGYFHGNWEIEHKDEDGSESIRENRTYEAGVLQSYEVVIDDKTFDIFYSGLDTSMSDDEVWEDYALEDGYFEILSLVKPEVEQSISNSVMATIDAYHQKSNKFIKNSILTFSFSSGFDIWNSIKGSSALGLGKFMVRKFEFTSDEKTKIQEIDENFKKIQSILKEFSENPKVKIGKPVHEKFNEVELIYGIYENELGQLKNMVDVLTSYALEYVNRDEIYNKIRPNLRFPVEVTYEFRSELVTKTHDFPDSPERQNFDLDKAHSLIKNSFEDIETLYEEVQEIFEAMEVEKSLSKDEEKLVERKEKIENLFDIDSEEESFNTYHERYAEEVLNLTEDTFDSYRSLGVEGKKNKIKSLLKCYQNLIDFYGFLENIELKNDRLDEAYTNTTFNPYIMVDMSERIKENVYKAFDDVLKPYLFSKLEDQFSCENVALAMEDINNVYQKILDLSKQDTKSVEKELRRQKDPEAILSVLELELKF